MKKTLLASAILLAFATTTAVAAETVSLKGGTFSSTVQVDGQAVDFTSAVTLSGAATIQGKDGALVDVNVKGTFKNQSTAEVQVKDLTASGNYYGNESAVLTGEDLAFAGMDSTSGGSRAYGTINAQTLSAKNIVQNAKLKLNVDKLVVLKSANFTSADDVVINDTLEIGDAYVGFANGTKSQTIANVLLTSQKNSQLQLNGTDLEAENLTVSDNGWGDIYSYKGGFTANVGNVAVGENAILSTAGNSSDSVETLNITTATFANNSTYVGDWYSRPVDADTAKTVENVSISKLVINGNTLFASVGDTFKDKYYAQEVANLRIGTIVLNEGLLTMNHSVQGMPLASGMARTTQTGLNIVVNEGASVKFGSTVDADVVNIELNNLEPNAVDASEADIRSESTTVTVPGELNNSEDIVDQVQQALSFGDNQYEVEIEEGQYHGAKTVGADGTVEKSVNSLMSNTLDVATSAPLAMNRMLMNDVRKRLGNIRSAEGMHGVWARYDGGRLSGAMGLENDFHTLQFGIDTVPVADAPRFGVAFSYTQSDADMKRGGAEMDAFGLAAYATKMYDNGAFVDVIGRIAKADTDMVVDGNKTGSMDNLAVSLSGEFGWRFNMTDRHYVEPQVEVTYTHVNNSDLVLSNGSKYDIDAVDSVIGRAGFVAGFTCPNNKGDIYVRASAVHEFLGDATIRGGSAIHELDGDDTWFEYAIGANFNINKNTYVYADIERTSGGALDEDWRANVGVRYSF